MITLRRFIAVSSFALPLTLLGAASQSAYAMPPVCQSASSDSDGDGYGWENNATCLVTTASGSGSSQSGPVQSGGSGLPTCASAATDPDGDGYGFENGASCLVNGASTNQSGSSQSGSSQSGSGLPTCASAATDPDGDGYGFENGASCLVGASGGSSSSSAPVSNSAPSHPACASANSDPDGDGFGFENGASCVVTASASSGIISDDAGSAASNGISDDAGSATSNGVTAPDAPSGGAPSSGGNNGGSANNDGGSFSSGTDGGTVLRTTSLQSTTPRSATVNSNGGDNFSTQQAGDYLLHQNAWRASRAAPGHPWSQTISTNNNGAPVGWSYDWGPGVPGANGRASDDFFVRSYPELIHGIKDEFRTSAPKSVIGLPERVDGFPTTRIDYAFNSSQFGASRTVNASVTSRFPNGTTIQGERNVAVESFLYNSVNGVCDDNLPVNRSNGSNHAFEVMVWLDSGAERLPAASRNYVTTISLRGASYDVYTKSDDPRYIAFVARNPQTSGTIYWNDYLDWARQNAHRVEERFGAVSNANQIQDSWCVGNILVGTEIFWGAGTFDLLEWTITQSQ